MRVCFLGLSNVVRILSLETGGGVEQVAREVGIGSIKVQNKSTYHHVNYCIFSIHVIVHVVVNMF